MNVGEGLWGGLLFHFLLVDIDTLLGCFPLGKGITRHISSALSTDTRNGNTPVPFHPASGLQYLLRPSWVPAQRTIEVRWSGGRWSGDGQCGGTFLCIFKQVTLWVFCTVVFCVDVWMKRNWSRDAVKSKWSTGWVWRHWSCDVLFWVNASPV